jgi:hypothetical protein
MKRISLI